MIELIAAVMALALFAYAVLGGADFGGGIWDLFASGARRDKQRRAIAQAMGPVWEANHVWLIFVIVILFTAFPRVYATLSTTLYLPFHLVLLGIVLRGAAFVFRAYGHRAGMTVSRAEIGWGVVFGAASTITPLLLGMCLGAVSQDSNWRSPVALATGLLALALCAYLAAVYLTVETRAELQNDFRNRALLAGTATVGLSVVTLPLLRSQAPHLWQGLFSPRALPILLVGAAAALLAGYALQRRRYRLARAAAITQIVMLLAGWMAAQYPYIVYPDLTLYSAAAPPATLRFFIWTLPFGALVLGPSLYLLFHVFKREIS